MAAGLMKRKEKPAEVANPKHSALRLTLTLTLALTRALAPGLGLAPTLT